MDGGMSQRLYDINGDYFYRMTPEGLREDASRHPNERTAAAVKAWNMQNLIHYQMANGYFFKEDAEGRRTACGWDGRGATPEEVAQVQAYNERHTGRPQGPE
jgi:hypothetical protein